MNKTRLQSQAQGTSRNLQKQPESRGQCYRRLCGIFWPTDKKMKVIGIRTRSEDPVGYDPSNSYSNSVYLPDAIQEALSEYWTPAYSMKPVDIDEARHLSNFHSRRNGHQSEFESLELMRMTLPTPSDLLRTLLLGLMGLVMPFIN